ncbi:MAG: DUF721 domain-containing protein [candidate division WOR-3 bacterium]
MKLRYPEKISKVLPRVLKSLDLETRFKQIELINRWPDIVGKKIAEHARAISINEGNLFVVVDNPLWHAQLSLLKKEIIKKFNQLGANLKDIKFIIDKGGRVKE